MSIVIEEHTKLILNDSFVKGHNLLSGCARVLFVEDDKITVEIDTGDSYGGSQVSITVTLDAVKSIDLSDGYEFPFNLKSNYSKFLCAKSWALCAQFGEDQIEYYLKTLNISIDDVGAEEAIKDLEDKYHAILAEYGQTVETVTV